MTLQGFRDFVFKLASLGHTDIFRLKAGITYFPLFHFTPPLRRIEGKEFQASCKFVFVVAHGTRKLETRQIPLDIMK